MIYSRFDPVMGEYDYFEGGDPLAAINDDLPVPNMPRPVDGMGAEIGLPSVELGRRLPSGATHVGRGQFAEGHVTPPSSVRLGGTGTFGSWAMDVGSFVAGAAVVGLVWVLWGRR